MRRLLRLLPKRGAIRTGSRETHRNNHAVYFGTVTAVLPYYTSYAVAVRCAEQTLIDVPAQAASKIS